MSRTKRRLLGGIAALALGGGLASIVAPPATAQVSPTAAIIINEVYGGSGSADPTYGQDFVELYNTTAAPVDLTGWSVQYRSAEGKSWTGNATLSGSIPAKGYYLLATVVGNPGQALPPPNATGKFDISGSKGNVALVNNTTTLACGSACANVDPSVVDFVGFGTADDFAGTVGTAPAGGATKAQSRDAAHTNTANNRADFQALDPTPMNSSMKDSTVRVTAPGDASVDLGVAWSGSWVGTNLGTGTGVYAWVDTPTAHPTWLSLDTATGEVTGTPPAGSAGSYQLTVSYTNGVDTASASMTLTVRDPAVPALTVAQARAQASGEVTTRGVVTASYPTGGFNGFVIQQPGSGGANYLATATGSQAIFVYLGASLAAGAPAIGSYVEVTGDRNAYYGLEQINVSAAADVAVIDESVAAPVPVTDDWPRDETERAKLQSMLYQPTNGFTVSNTYDASSTSAGAGISSARFGEVGLAFGDSPLRNPTDMARPNSAEAKAVAADNIARRIILDDGASLNYATTAQGTLPAYYSESAPVRVGAAVTLTSPMIADWRLSNWKLEPTAPLTGADAARYPVSFANTRTPAPDQGAIGDADLTVASFNVLNYFTTTGEKWESLGGGRSCDYYYDATRTIKTTVSDCSGSSLDGVANSGPRGAADAASLARQQSKIVAAINALDADIVGLLEIENSSRVLGAAHQDEAIATLVDALNTAAGAEKWAFVPSNPAVMVPAAQQDVITQALIYQPAAVSPVGAFKADTETAAFSNARKPIGQAFEPAGGGEALFVTANHLKSKGSGAADPCASDPACAQGAANADRVAQATELSRWVAEDVLPSYQTELGRAVTAAAIIGDINAYTFEDPMQVFKDAGYTDVNEYEGNPSASYSYSGTSGSLDHVLLNAAAMERYTGSDIWNINAGEALWLEYSRYGAVAGSFVNPATPYRSSDHDPVIAGLSVPALPDPLVLTAPQASAPIALGEAWSGSFVASGGVEPYTYTLVNPPRGASIAADGTVSFTSADLTGQITITVKVTDHAGREATASVTLRVTPAAQECAPLDTALYRFYKTDGTHFYTTSASEAEMVKSYSEYRYEGISGYVGDATATPCAGQAYLYRFYKPGSGTHFYTASEHEANLVRTYLDYSFEGIAGIVDTTATSDTTAMYRFYKAAAGTHFYTASPYERAMVLGYGEYRYESIAYYLRPAG